VGKFKGGKIAKRGLRRKHGGGGMHKEEIKSENMPGGHGVGVQRLKGSGGGVEVSYENVKVKFILCARV